MFALQNFPQALSRQEAAIHSSGNGDVGLSGFSTRTTTGEQVTLIVVRTKTAPMNTVKKEISYGMYTIAVGTPRFLHFR